METFAQLEAFIQSDSLLRILVSMVFVLVAIGISRWQSADLEKDLLVATIRSFIQLILIGFALELIFESDTPITTIAILLVMTLIAARTTQNRVKSVTNSGQTALWSIGIGSALTISVLLLLGVFTFIPQEIIPIGGMVIGNSMTTASLVMSRLRDDVHGQRDMIESMLALGATSHRASLKQFRSALRSAMIPIVDTTKTVGLIKLPGAMTGMILAGASPLEAVELQIIVMYMLVGAATFTGLIAAFLTLRQFFTTEHQLVLATGEAKIT